MVKMAKREDDLSDYGTPERHAKGVMRLVDIEIGSGYKTTKVAKDIALTTIQRLFNRKVISQVMLDCGERLYADWFDAGMEPAVITNLLRTRGGVVDKAQRQIDAKKRFDEAMRFIGRDLNDMIYDVVILDWSLSDAEHKRGWGKGAGTQVFLIGMTRLCEHYGYDNPV